MKGQFSTRKFTQSLLLKGFKGPEERSHHYYTFYYKGKKTIIYTYTGHSEKEFGFSLVRARKSQMKLNNTKDFKDFYNCPMSGEDYLTYLLINNIISA